MGLCGAGVPRAGVGAKGDRHNAQTSVALGSSASPVLSLQLACLLSHRTQDPDRQLAVSPRESRQLPGQPGITRRGRSPVPGTATLGGVATSHRDRVRRCFPGEAWIHCSGEHVDVSLISQMWSLKFCFRKLFNAMRSPPLIFQCTSRVESPEGRGNAYNTTHVQVKRWRLGGPQCPPRQA